MFSALNKNKEAPRLSFLSKSLFTISIFISLFCYYALLSYRSAKATAISGELSLNPQSTQLASDGSFIGFLFSYFGSFSYVLPLFIIYCGYVLFIKHISLKQVDLFNISLRILGFNLLVIGTTATFSFCFSLDETGGGGILGDFLNIVFRSFAPGLLGTVLSVLVSLTGLSLFVAMSPLALLDKIGSSITSLFGAKTNKETNDKEQEPIINTDNHKDDGRKFGIAKVFNSAGSIPSFKGKKEDLNDKTDFAHNIADRLEPVFDSQNQDGNDVVDIENIKIKDEVTTSSTLIDDSKEVHNFKNPQEPSFGADDKYSNENGLLDEAKSNFVQDDGSLNAYANQNVGEASLKDSDGNYHDNKIQEGPAYLDSNFRPQALNTNVQENTYEQTQRATYIAPREPLDGSQSGINTYSQRDQRPSESTYIIDNTKRDEKNSYDKEDDTPNTYIINRAELLRQEQMRREAYERETQEALVARNATAAQDANNQNDDGEVHSIITDRSALTEQLLQRNYDKIQKQRQEEYQKEINKISDDNDTHSTIITHRDPNALNGANNIDTRSSYVNDNQSINNDNLANNSATTTTHSAGSYTVNLGSFDTFSASVVPESNLQNTNGNDPYANTIKNDQDNYVKDGFNGYTDPHKAFGNYDQNANDYSSTQNATGSLDNGTHSIDTNNSPSYLDVKKSFGFADENQNFENVISFEDNKDDTDKFEGKGYDVGDKLTPAFTPNTNAHVHENNLNTNALNKNPQKAISEKDASYEYHRASRGVFGSDISDSQTDLVDKNHEDSNLSATSTMDYSNTYSNYSQKDNNATSYKQEEIARSNLEPDYSQANQSQDSYHANENNSLNDNLNTSSQYGVEDRSIGNNSQYKTGFVEQNSSGNNYPSYMQDERVNDNSLTTIQIPFKSNVVTAPNHVYDSWRPDVNLLTPSHSQDDVDTDALNQMAAKIDAALSSFGVKAHVERYVTGPVITRYELSLAPGIKSSAISSISVDLGRTLTVGNVRVIDVIPGTSYVGIELPNKNRKLITLYDVASKRDFAENEYKLPLCLGCSVTGDPVVVDLVKAPHLLVAGTTGSGKSAGLNAMLVSMLLKKSPEELRLILIDPKRVEFSLYNSLPHLITPIISDVADKAAAALRWCVEEMERRYQLIEDNEVRKLDEYNAKVKEAAARGEVLYDKSWTADKGGTPPVLKPLPLLVVVIEEYADLVAQTSGGRKKNENSPEQYINRLAAKARAAGIHLILATQSPRSDVLTGVIKNNIPARIAFTVQSMIDSRVILDEGGAEKLLGNGDMLCKFTSINQGVSFRCHGAFVSNDDVDRIVEAWREHGEVEYIDDVTEDPVEESEPIEDKGGNDKRDKKLEEAATFALEYYSQHQKYPPISDFQIMLGVGYPRAKKIYIQLQKEGIIN